MTVAPRTPAAPRTVGWREWVALPELGIEHVKAKVDTGARTSSLHAVRVRRVEAPGEAPRVAFEVHPEQRDGKLTVRCEAPLLAERSVRSSSGHSELRPVVAVAVRVLEETFVVELTLTSRDEMGFRMLLGREALRGRFLVDPARSFLGGRRRRKKPRKRRPAP